MSGGVSEGAGIILLVVFFNLQIGLRFYIVFLFQLNLIGFWMDNIDL